VRSGSVLFVILIWMSRFNTILGDGGWTSVGTAAGKPLLAVLERRRYKTLRVVTMRTRADLRSGVVISAARLPIGSAGAVKLSAGERLDVREYVQIDGIKQVRVPM
jgi:hypothetical protein